MNYAVVPQSHCSIWCVACPHLFTGCLTTLKWVRSYVTKLTLEIAVTDGQACAPDWGLCCWASDVDDQCVAHPHQKGVLQSPLSCGGFPHGKKRELSLFDGVGFYVACLPRRVEQRVNCHGFCLVNSKDTAAAARTAVDTQTQRGQEKLEGLFSWYGETHLPDRMDYTRCKQRNRTSRSGSPGFEYVVFVLTDVNDWLCVCARVTTFPENQR